jgi:hypothetical protein
MPTKRRRPSINITIDPEIHAMALKKLPMKRRKIWNFSGLVEYLLADFLMK